MASQFDRGARSLSPMLQPLPAGACIGQLGIERGYLTCSVVIRTRINTLEPHYLALLINLVAVGRGILGHGRIG